MLQNTHISSLRTRCALMTAAIGAFLFAFAATVPAQDQPEKGRVIPASRPVSERSANIRNAAITDKPRPSYTESAKQNGVEGTIRLRVELLGTGAVGEVVPLSYLPWGLTEQAINAAKQIRFVPKTIEGRPVDSTVNVEYTFSLFYEDSDPEITSKVEIQRLPKPEIEASELPASANRRIELKIYFSPHGRASIVNTLTALPFEFQPRLRDAVEKIRYRPAIHRSGKRSGVTKVVVYEF